MWYQIGVPSYVPDLSKLDALLHKELHEEKKEYGGNKEHCEVNLLRPKI